MGLQDYKRKRHFTSTPEPEGRPASRGGHSYCIQKHDASSLHYDFRLELDGVLKSWAVPEGPSLDPSAKRLAMHVEDHPVEYGGFEGTIPQGQYGGGTVLLWDRGEWEPVGDAAAGYRDGRLKFQLHGQKLHGGWVLVRTGGPGSTREGRRWLLIKEQDESAKPSDKGDVLEEMPLSVSSGRDLDEIAGVERPAAKRKPKPDPPKPRLVAARKEGDAHKEELDGVRLTSQDKILYPDVGLTKLDLAEYYRDTAEWLLPHLADRPLALVRCPEGQGGERFFQKHPGPGTPDVLRRISIRQKSSIEEYVVVDDVAGLVSLAQIGVLEIHAWGSRSDRLDRPDRLVFDLDPDPAVPWKQVAEGGREVRRFLQELGLESFVKLTGGKGLHVVVPIERSHEWAVAKAFCKEVADAVVAGDPTGYTTNLAKAARHGKIFIDYLRNDRGSTAVVPFSPRATANASVAVPIAWDELSARVPSDHYTISTLPRRLASLRADPWEEMATTRQTLTAAWKVLRSLTK